MFYSHQILARKGPLATVWMAAHLQHRLKKPHYNSVDINSTIDRIIWPEAPIALRMSGHLLLGVVRIYSKKVDYLYHDCNDAMVKVSKAFTPAEAYVTEAPAKASVDEVTLPERYELDALELNEYMLTERGVDSYIRSPEDITLPDTTPLNMDQYVAVTFEDLDMTPMGTSFRDLGSGQERDALQPATADETESSGGAGPGPGPSIQPEPTAERIHGHQTPQSIEVMRHAVLDSTLPDLPLPYRTSDEAEKQKADASDKEKEFVSPVGEELLESGGQPSSFRPQQMGAAVVEESPTLFGSHLSFGQGSVELAIRSTPSVPRVHVPPVEVALRRGKRKLYDERAIVLSNKALKDALNDTSKIVRKKWRLPDSSIGSWRLEKIIRKEQIFTGPLLTGMSEDLHDICKDLSAKPHFAIIEEPMQESGDQQPPEVGFQPEVSQGIAVQPIEGETEGDFIIQIEEEGDTLRSADVQATPAPDRQAEEGEEVSPSEVDMEIERLRRHEGDVGTSMMPEFTPIAVLHSPALGSPTRRDDMPAVSAGSYFVPGLFPTLGLASSAETLEPEAEQQPSFSDIPEVIKSPGSDDLHFLDADSFETGTRGTQDATSLSVRARGAAQYLKDKLSPGTPSSADQSAIFSLNDILQGQPRKRCARMFYEILVLKSADLIDVAQTESYGDITLKVTPVLKAQL